MTETPPEETEKAILIRDMLSVRDARDRAAFARLFGHFAPRVKGFLIRAGSDPAVAEDCAQDVMVTVWNKAHLYDPARASVATWVFTIARNRRIDIVIQQPKPPDEEVDAREKPKTKLHSKPNAR